MVGRTSVWVDKDRRTRLGHKFVLSVDASLESHGLTRGDHKALRRVISELPSEYKSWTEGALRRAYYRAQPLPPPLPTEEERWVSMLGKWGMSPEKAQELVDRLIAITTAAHKRTDLGQLFDYVGRRRMYSRPRKVKWLQRAADRIQADRHYWPIHVGREPPDKNAGRVISWLRDAPGNRGTLSEIAAGTGIKPRTCQDLLVSMNESKDVVRVADGEYARPASGTIVPYVPPSIAILKALADGPTTPAELCIRTGKTKSQIAGALHWLWKHKRIVRLRIGLWGAAPGSALPHIIARDAIIKALESGSKTVSELMTGTGKNRGEIWAALRRLKAEQSIVEAYLIYPGRRGYRAAFALARH